MSLDKLRKCKMTLKCLIAVIFLSLYQSSPEEVVYLCVIAHMFFLYNSEIFRREIFFPQDLKKLEVLYFA